MKFNNEKQVIVPKEEYDSMEKQILELMKFKEERMVCNLYTRHTDYCRTTRREYFYGDHKEAYEAIYREKEAASAEDKRQQIAKLNSNHSHDMVRVQRKLADVADERDKYKSTLDDLLECNLFQYIKNYFRLRKT